MTATVTAAHMITDEEFRAEFNRLEREKRMAEIREQNRKSPSNGKVWFYKEKDKYGRTVRVVHTMEDGVQRTMGVVVLIPRWTPAHPMKKFFSNDFSVNSGHPTTNGAVVEHDTAKAALARFGCGTVEGERY